MSRQQTSADGCRSGAAGCKGHRAGLPIVECALITEIMADTFTKHSISHDSAQLMVAAAVARARTLGTAQAVAILDESGLLKAFCHMDGAPVAGIEVAHFEGR
jgi:hypothetical protein